MENLEQMTLEQMTALQKEKLERHEELTREITHVSNDLHKINPILAQKMTEASPLMGKKVKVVSRKWGWCEDTKTVVGYFGGYFSPFGSDHIYPTVYKMKKDGTPSKNKYSDYDVRELDKVISIEEVTE